MWSEQISDSLSEHIDGTRQCVLRPPLSLNDPLHVCHPSFNLGEDSEDIEI